MNSKLDRRKKYTRMVLKEGIIKLLKEKQISSITVKEICEQADINRSTFYSHYSDQYDLLNKIEEELLNDMTDYLNKFNFEKEDESMQMLEKLLEYIVSKRDICQTLLNENGDTTFLNRVMRIAQQFLMKNWITVSGHDEDISDYVSTYVVSGSTYVIKSWLDKGLDKTPKEMAEIINTITKVG